MWKVTIHGEYGDLVIEYETEELALAGYERARKKAAFGRLRITMEPVARH